VNGIKLHHRDVGSGSPVVLLHGNGQNNSLFRHLERYLTLNHRVILIDSRGHGQSERGSSPISIPLMAKDVAAVMSTLEIERAAIVGFSDGGNVALQMAVDFPDRVDSVISIIGNARPEGLNRVYLWLLRLRKRLLSTFKRDTSMVDLLLTQPRISNADLEKITAPVLLLYGSRDLVAKSHADELHRHIPRSRLKIIGGTQHITIISKWYKYADEMEQFIDACDPNRD
jgi:pimeloyl-ACP methyl ester carboxylesterase